MTRLLRSSTVAVQAVGRFCSPMMPAIWAGSNATDRTCVTLSSASTGTRTLSTGRFAVAPVKRSCTKGSRVSITSLSASGSAPFGSGVPQGTRVLTSC